MKTTVDYANNLAPQHAAVNDIIEYLGERYAQIAQQMRLVTDHQQFSMWCSFMGIEGYPIAAWYDHFHGGGAWDRAANE